MGSSVGRIYLDLGINTSGFEKQLGGLNKTVGKSVLNLGVSFGKIGKLAAVAFSVKAVTDFGKACLELGSDLSEVQNVVDVTFGDMSGKVNSFAKEAMTSFGLSEKVGKQYMGTFGAMSKAFGYSTQAAYDQAAALTALTGDVASFYNLSTNAAHTKLKSVFTGETESLKELGIVMTQTALDEYAMQKGLGKTTAKMSEQEKVALRLSFVQDRLSAASGDFARTSGGWANQTRVLSLRFDALKASIGRGLIVALTPAVKLLNQLVERLQTAADAFSGFMQSIFGTSPTISSGMGVVAAASSELSLNTADTAISAAKIKKTLAGFDALNILSGDSRDGGTDTASSLPAGSVAVPELTKSASTVDSLIPKLDILKSMLMSFAEITGIKGLWNDFSAGLSNAKLGVGNLFDALCSSLSASMPALEGLRVGIVNTFLTATGTVTAIWGDLWTQLTDNFRLFTENNSADVELLFSNVISRFTGYASLITDISGQLYADLGAWWNKSGKPLADGIMKLISDIGKRLIDIYNGIIAPVVLRVTEKARELWDEALRPLWQNILGSVSDIGNCILALWNNPLRPLVDWVIENIGPRIKETLMKTVDTVKQAIANIGGYIDGVITTFRGVLKFITGVFTGDWKKAWEGIRQGFEGQMKSLRNGIGLFLNPMLSNIESFINGIIQGLNFLIRQINKISFDVPDWVPGIGGEKLGFNIKNVSEVTLPRLANGGYVAANTPRLAIVGDNRREGEIIAPESKIAEAVARGFAQVLSKLKGTEERQSDRPIYLTVKLGDDTLWEGFVEYHNGIVKSTGETPLLV